MRERARARRGALSSPPLRAQHGHFAVDAALYVFAGACTAAALLLRAGSARARAASESQVVTLGTGIALALLGSAYAQAHARARLEECVARLNACNSRVAEAEVLRSRQMYITRTAHDLKTPVTSFRLALDQARATRRATRAERAARARARARERVASALFSPAPPPLAL